MITEKFSGMTKGKKRDARCNEALVKRQEKRSSIEDLEAELEFKRKYEL